MLRLCGSLLVVLASLIAPARAAAAPGQITLAGQMLLRDGRPWIIKGVKLTSRLVPPQAINRPIIGPHLREAQGLWSPTMPLRVRSFGADTAAIEVSQPGLDPASPIHDPQYRAEVVSAVAQLRQAGLTVMITMQWENGAGVPHQPDTPGPATGAAWANLLQALPRDDAGLVFEVFNEPMPQATFYPEIPRPLWVQWRLAHEAVIANIRAAGFHRQIVVVGGIDGAHRLDHAPEIADPDHRLVYAIHPYLTAGNLHFDTSAGWDQYFGQFCAHHPCMISEFALARRPDETPTGCQGDAPDMVRHLLVYAWNHHLGIVGWALDYPWTLMQGPDFATPTNFNAWAGTCAASTQPYGMGAVLRDWFLRH